MDELLDSSKPLRLNQEEIKNLNSAPWFSQPTTGRKAGLEGIIARRADPDSQAPPMNSTIELTWLTWAQVILPYMLERSHPICHLPYGGEDKEEMPPAPHHLWWVGELALRS